MGADELDTVAVQQDAASVHALATRALDEVDMHDPAVAVLATWVAEIDSGIDETTVFVMPQTPVGESSTIVIAASRGRRTALIAGSTVLALVVSGGAAAAVTGDPLALVRAPLHAMAKVNPFVDSESNARDRLPKQAPTAANANKLLADAQRAMANGDTAKANELLADAEALLGGSVNPGQQNRIDRLKGDPPGQSGSQQQPNQGSKGSSDPNGKGPVDRPDPDPKGKGTGTGSQETTEPSPGSTKGGSGKPSKDDTSNKDSGTDSDTPGGQGSDKAEDPGSRKSSHSPKSSPRG